MECLETCSVGSGQPRFASNGTEPANTPPFPRAPLHSPDAPTKLQVADDPLGTAGVAETNVTDECDDRAGGTEDTGGPINLGTADVTGTGHVDDASVTAGVDDASAVTGGTDDTNVAGTDDTNIAGTDGATVVGTELMNGIEGTDGAASRGSAAGDDI